MVMDFPARESRIKVTCTVQRLTRSGKTRSAATMLLPNLAVLAFLCVFAAAEESNSACSTPDHQQGECKPLKQCSVLYSLLESLTNEKMTYLRKSRCGGHGDNSNPKICCPGKVPVFPPKKGTTRDIESPLLPPKDACGLFSDKLIGGEVALLGFFPWTVLLKYQKGNESEFYCGGTLINGRYVLTAAHCLSKQYLPQNAKLISVRLGEHNLDTNPDCEHFSKDCALPIVEVPVEEVIIHEGFNSNSYQNSFNDNDIALVRLSKKFAINDLATPVCLPTHSADLNKNYNGVRLWRAGWDIDSHNVSNSEKLRNEILAKGRDDCKRMFNLTLTDNQFCAIKMQSYHRCSSDSGGGVSLSGTSAPGHYVAGVEVWHGPCGQNQVAVYTKVNRYMAWIVKNLRE